MLLNRWWRILRLLYQQDFSSSNAKGLVHIVVWVRNGTTTATKMPGSIQNVNPETHLNSCLYKTVWIAHKRKCFVSIARTNTFLFDTTNEIMLSMILDSLVLLEGKRWRGRPTMQWIFNITKWMGLAFKRPRILLKTSKDWLMFVTDNVNR